MDRQLPTSFPARAAGSAGLSATAARWPARPPQDARTLYLSVPDAITLVRRKGLATCLAGMAEALHADFLRWPAFEKSARVAHHAAQGVVELMPVADGSRYSFKYVNGHPGNTALGLPTVMAFGLLADMATGAPLFLSELTLITALRTAATSALAARALARPDSRVMAIIGNGAQSDFQALAFAHLLGIDTLRLYDIDPAATAKLVAHLAGSGLRTVVCASTREALQGADIVTTVTADKQNATIVSADMLAPGMHLNAVGGDCPGKTELAPEVLQAAHVVVEYEPQSRIEGEIQQMPADFPVTPLWAVLAGQASGRTQREQVTLFDSVGFALEDFSALRFLHRHALALGLGERLDLMPRLHDPKDLFATLAKAPASSGRAPGRGHALPHAHALA